MIAAWPKGFQTAPESQNWAMSTMPTWSFTQNGTFVLSNERTKYGAQSWKVTCSGTSTAQAIKNFSTGDVVADLDLSSRFVVLVLYAEQEQLTGSTSIGIGFGNTAGSSANLDTYYMNINAVKRGWNYIPLRLDFDPPANLLGYSRVRAGTGFDPTVTCKRIVLEVGAPQAGYVFHFDSLVVGRRSRSSFIVGFDSTGTPLIDYALPTLVAANIPCYLAISAAAGNEAAARVVYDEMAGRVATMREAGWVCINHSMRHPAGGYAIYSMDEVEQDWRQNQAILDSYGWFDDQDQIYRRFFVYPENKSNFNVEERLASLGLVCARGIKNIYTLPLNDGLDRPLNCGCVALDNSTTLTAAKNAVDEAIRRGATIHSFSHDLVTGSATALAWNKDDFNGLIAHVVLRRQQGLIDTPSWANWYAGLTQPALAAV